MRHSWIRFVALTALLLCPPLTAAVKPESTQTKNDKSLRMLDARVNAPAALKSASAARPGAETAGATEAARQGQEIARAVAEAKRTMPGLEVKGSAIGLAVSSVRNTRGALTAENASASNEQIVRGYLAQNAALYGLSAADLNDLAVLGSSAGGSSGLRLLRMEQQIDGLSVFQSETRFAIDPQGRLVKSVGRFVPAARAASRPASQWISAEQAIARLLASTGHVSKPESFRVTKPAEAAGGWIRLTETDAVAAGEISARKMLFPLAPGVVVPAWGLVVFTEGDADWYALVDAVTGDVLWRKNIRNHASTHDARFRVYVQADGVTPADSPAPQSPSAAVPGAFTQFAEIAPTIVSMFTAQDIVASQNGWINDCPGGICTANETQTLGNNVLACMDRAGTANVCDTDAASQLDGNGRPTGNPDTNGRNRDFLGTTPRDFQTNFTPPPQGGAGNAEVGQTATGAGNGTSTGPTDIFRRGSTVQQFYVTNWYHDKLFALGFDEAAANFQQTNFSGNGTGGDRVLVDVQDGSGTNNANFATPPDGVSGRAQMFRFTGPTIDRDGGLDSEILIHELTHGTSNRLVGNGAGLNWDPAGSMGEGWSDFYALSLLNNTNADDPNASYAAGAYATFKLGGGQDNYVYAIRRFPYSTNNTVNPLTWADIDDVTGDMSGGIAVNPLGFEFNGGMEVHNAGELWANSLWEVRSRIIADPAGANGSVPTGNNTMLEIVTDAMRLFTPIDPSFTDSRDALFDADCAANACANEESIWGGFADRGLGYGARAPFNVLFGFTAGHLGVRESFSSPFLDVVNVATDVAINDAAANNNGAMDPGEPILLTVTLTNPWRAASKAVGSATAVLSTTTPGVTVHDNASTYGAIAPQGTAAGDTFLISLDSTVLCGSAINFTLTTTSTLGVTATTFQLRVGAAAGTDPVVTYTRDTNPDLAIPDGTPLAVFDQLNVTDDFVIADLNFRVDSATHTFNGDLTFMLRSPGGIGEDSITLIGGLTDGGSGDNLLNTVADDDLVSSPAVDLVQQTNAGAPFTGSWLPVFNAPWTTLAGFPAPDPVGTLSRFDGTSTLGTWSVAASDQFAADTGTLNAWSMLVTPVHFNCTPFAAVANVGGTKTVSGTFAVGGTVTYTVTLTNSGTDPQGDNAGNEFTDTLPASLTLVSAVATSGTAGTAGNTVNWNGTLAPLGGSVTITITATINAGTQGQTISNQGTASYDSNNDNVNDASALTDDPGVGGAADPTQFVVGASALSATKTAAGTFEEGGAITYTIVISNGGGSASPDNAGDEFTDVLPAGMTLVSATATSGTPVANVGLNTVTWNGSIPASGSVTITINATIDAGSAGSNLSNQGTVNFDADLNGSNESSAPTDDPAVGGATDPTVIAVVGVSVIEVPTLSDFGLGAMGLALFAAAARRLRRRKQ